MILYRIAKGAYVDDLSGTGSRLYGGRWNSKGRPAVYLASSRALALVEVLVHLPSTIIPDNYFAVSVEVPDSSIRQIAIADLPANWNDMTAPIALKKIGDQFLSDNKYLLLKVPSAVVPAESNYLLNVLHPDMHKVRILKKEPFSFDKRLLD